MRALASPLKVWQVECDPLLEAALLAQDGSATFYDRGGHAKTLTIAEVRQVRASAIVVTTSAPFHVKGLQWAAGDD